MMDLSIPSNIRVWIKYLLYAFAFWFCVVFLGARFLVWPAANFVQNNDWLSGLNYLPVFGSYFTLLFFYIVCGIALAFAFRARAISVSLLVWGIDVFCSIVVFGVFSKIDAPGGGWYNRIVGHVLVPGFVVLAPICLWSIRRFLNKSSRA